MFKNWKTTLLGLGLGGANLVANGVHWKQALVSVGLAGLGLLAKDFNVTGAGSNATAAPILGPDKGWFPAAQKG